MLKITLKKHTLLSRCFSSMRCFLSPSFSKILSPLSLSRQVWCRMGPQRRARDLVNMLFGWVRRQLVRVKVFLGAVAALVVLVGLKFFVRDYQHFYIASEVVLAAGILLLIYKLTRQKTCSEMAEEFRSIQLIDGVGEFNKPGLSNFLKAVRSAECGISYAVASIMGPQSSEMAVGFRSIQLIDGDGEFNRSGLENFVKAVRLAECGLSYAVVSIMGPQSSGKSTLLNHLFGTNFREMNASNGRSQTTKGIWMARCGGIDPCTIVMDLEGTDGSERGEDDTVFERQSALFALAVSDIVLINMWCHDIGREQAANKPLLKTVFQVMMKLFSPRKTTLMFVIRDITKTPLEKLEPDLRKDIQKIWDSVPKPEVHKETSLSEFFNVEVVALSSYEEKKKQFKEQVASLRQRFFHSIAPGGLAGDRRGVVAASAFAFSAEEFWKVIKENKDLDFPSHMVMVASVRCEAIANEKFAYLTTADEEWCQLKAAVENDIVPEFGKKLSSILKNCLSGYDTEVIYFDEGVRTAKRQLLESNILLFVYPAYQSMLGHLRSKTLDDFKKALDKALESGVRFADATRDCKESFMSKFDEGVKDAAIEQAKWDSSNIRDMLQRDVASHIKSETIRKEKRKEMVQAELKMLKAALKDKNRNKNMKQFGIGAAWGALHTGRGLLHAFCLLHGLLPLNGVVEEVTELTNDALMKASEKADGSTEALEGMIKKLEAELGA